MGKTKQGKSLNTLSTLSQKTKKSNQKTKRFKDQKTEDIPKDIETLDSELGQLKAQALLENGEAMKLSKESFNLITKAIDESEIIFQILDGRDPYGCRLTEIEKRIKDKGKTLINIINKCDLIPTDVAIRWLGDQSLTDSSDKLIGISSNSEEIESASKLLSEMLETIPNLNHQSIISIIGIKKVGKSSLFNILKDIGFENLHEISSYEFLMPTSSASLLNAVDIWEDLSEFALEFLSRCQDESIFDVIGIEPCEDVDEVMTQYSKVIKKTLRQTTKEFANKLLDGSLPFFSIPDDTPLQSISNSQKAVLDSLEAKGKDFDTHIHIVKGDPLEINPEILE